MTDNILTHPIRLLPTLAVCCLAVLAACSNQEQPGESAADTAERERRLIIHAVSFPLTDFARRIGGEHVDVRFAVPANTDPAFWRPSAEAILDLQRADVILLNGAGYASWVHNATLPIERLVDTSAGFTANYIRDDANLAHQHGPDGGTHQHGEIAFTTWLDPKLAIMQARAVRDALAAYLPDYTAELDANLAQLETELNELDEQLRATFSLMSGAGIAFSHPVYQYLARAYELSGTTVQWEPTEDIPADELQRLASSMDGKLTVMLWEQQPSAANRAALADAGIRIAVFNPAANPGSDSDYFEIMDSNARNVLEAIQ